MQFPYGPYAPDKGDMTPGICVTANNVMPIPDGYGPAPTMALPGGGSALPGPPRGMATTIKRDGTTQIFAFTETAVYALASDYTFTPIETGYNCTAGADWSAVQFGDFLLYTNTTDGLWAYNIEVGGSATYIADAGDPGQLFVNANMVFALDCEDNSGNRDNRLIRNSDFNDHTNWKTRAADQQRLESGAELVAGVRLKNGAAVVFQRESMRLIQFGAAGGGALYSLQEIAEGRGAVSARSVIGFDGVVYWISTNGIWQFSTGGLVPIGDGFVDRWFISVAGDLTKVQAAIDPLRKVVLWLIPDANIVLGYCWAPSVTNRWFTWTSTATYLTRLSTSGYTWDAAGAVWATWEDMPAIPFDDRFWKGGEQFLAALDENYMLNSYSGPSAAARLRTSKQPSPVSGMISWATSMDDCPTSTLKIGVTDALHVPIVQKSAEGKVASGRTPLRGRGKVIDFEFNAPSGAVWNYAFGVDQISAATGGPR